MSNKILGNEIFSNDGRENIHAATLNAVTPESGMSHRTIGSIGHNPESFSALEYDTSDVSY